MLPEVLVHNVLPVLHYVPITHIVQKKFIKIPIKNKKKSPKKYFKKGDLPTPLTHNNTQQHYTTALGYIKLLMYQLFLWRLYIMVLRGAISL